MIVLTDSLLTAMALQSFQCIILGLISLTEESILLKHRSSFSLEFARYEG